MKAEKSLRLVVISLLAVGYAQPVLRGAENQMPGLQARKVSFGTIVGVVRTSSSSPVGGATVTAVRTDGSGIRATVSGSDGIYSFADLLPGAWSVTSQADGYPDTAALSLNVTAGRATRSDIVMAVAMPEPTVAEPGMISSTSSPREAPSSQSAAVTASGASPDAVRSRWSKGEKAALDEIKSAIGLGEKQNLPKTASLRPPVSAFDTRVPDAPGLGPQTPPAPAPAVSSAPAAINVPAALQSPDAAPAVDTATPFAFGDFTWLNGTPRNKDTVLDTKFFTPEVRFDTHFMEDFNQPIDHTIVGATESFRSGEIQEEQISVGGDFHWQNVRGRILYMSGLFATTTPRNDASAGVGQWDLRDAYKYVSEAYGGYHFNVNHGLNIDAGIFVSYIGLFSYYNFDNWTYQPSYVSSNTPWFFNGLRVQWFPTNKLKIEPWLINGWQSYAKYNGHMGLGGQILWMPKEWLKVVANQYGYGQDNLGLPKTQRIHTDDSIEVRYYYNPDNGSGVSKMAFSLTADAGCQYGGGLTCHNGANKSDFLGWMLYDRVWWHHDLFAVTLGGGYMTNPGRYLTLLPPIDGADAVSGTPYFTESPGQTVHQWDSTVTFHYMPRQYITWWGEVGYRHSDIPYFAGRGGVTPPGGNNGLPQYFTCTSGASSGTNNLATAQTACGGAYNVWFPDLRRSESKVSVGVMVKF